MSDPCSYIRRIDDSQPVQWQIEALDEQLTVLRERLDALRARLDEAVAASTREDALLVTPRRGGWGWTFALAFYNNGPTFESKLGTPLVGSTVKAYGGGRASGSVSPPVLHSW